jgi:enoyl-CoA hydratase/carnithine racemase
MTGHPEPVLLERRDHGIAVLRLNRPDKRNALDSAGLAVLEAAFTTLAADDELRALVLSTTDTAAFCAGADIGEPLDDAGGVRRMAAFTRLYTALDAFPVPVVTVCVGNCVGAGAELVAGSDLRVAGDNLKLAWAGARLGVPVGPARLSQLVGVGRAKELVFTGRSVDASEAHGLGLVHSVVPAAAAEAAALEIAATIARQSATGIRALKQLFRDLDGTASRIAHENARLLDFQRHGAGLPRG